MAVGQGEDGVLQRGFHHAQPAELGARRHERARQRARHLVRVAELDHEGAGLMTLEHRGHVDAAGEVSGGGLDQSRGIGHHDPDRRPASSGRLQRGGASLRHMTALADDVYVVAQLLHLGEIVGGEQHSPALVREAGDHQPQLACDGRVQTEGGFVEQQIGGVVDQASGDGEPLGHAARVSLHDDVPGFLQADEPEQFVGPRAKDGPRHVVELPEVPEILATRHPRVHHALATGDQVDPPSHSVGVLHHVEVIDPDGAARGTEQGGQDLDRGGLPRAVEPEKAGHPAAGIDIDSPSTATLNSFGRKTLRETGNSFTRFAVSMLPFIPQ